MILSVEIVKSLDITDERSGVEPEKASMKLVGDILKMAR